MIERDGWNSIFCENHDQPRSVSRYTDDSDAWRSHGAKLLCLMQASLAGTLYVYQGEELGLRNVPVEWEPEEYKDIESINFWKKYNEMYPGDQQKLARAREILQRKARDNARTPMQWNSAAHAGFTASSSTPWMRVNTDYATVNAEAQLKDPDSVRAFWQKQLRFRKERKDVFVYGDFECLDLEHGKVVAWRRWSEKEEWVFVGNFSGEEIRWSGLQDVGVEVEKWVVGNCAEGLGEKSTRGALTLRPWEGLLGRVR